MTAPCRTNSERAYRRARLAYDLKDYQGAVHWQRVAAWYWIQEHYWDLRDGPYNVVRP